MLNEEIKRAIEEGKCWRETWNEIPVDYTESSVSSPDSMLFMTKEEAVASAEFYIEKLRRSGNAGILNSIGYFNLITGERLTVFQMVRRKVNI